MSNILNYTDALGELRTAVVEARAEFLGKMKQLEGYKGSKQGAKDIEAVKAGFEAKLEAARAVARPRFSRAIDGMKAKTVSDNVQPPSPAQLALLEMLELRDSIGAGELESAARAMGDNDGAFQTLSQIAKRKGSIIPASVKPFGVQRQEAVTALERASESMLAWDGRDSSEILSDYLAARNSYKWGDGEPPAQNAMAGRDAAEIEPQSFYKETARRIAGDDVPMEVIDSLD